MRVWLSELEGSDLAATTRQLYVLRPAATCSPRSGQCSSASSPSLPSNKPSRRSDPGTGRSPRGPRGAPCRACATARHGALRVNPVRDTRPIACPRKRVRALTVGAAADLLARLRADNRGPAGPSRLRGVHARHRRPHRRSLRNPASGDGPQGRNCAHQRQLSYGSTRPDWRSSRAPRPPDPNRSCTSHDTWCGCSSGVG
jgi:hypothetical protein